MVDEFVVDGKEERNKREVERRKPGCAAAKLN
jgi:hypothetical protein